MWLIAVYAAVAMVIEDILYALLTQAEARDRAWLSGFLDSAAWLAAIVTTTLSVTTLQGHSVIQKVLVIGLVSLANLFGSYTGVKLGSKFIKSEATK